MMTGKDSRIQSKADISERTTAFIVQYISGVKVLPGVRKERQFCVKK
jgi:hypothetical protein